MFLYFVAYAIVGPDPATSGWGNATIPRPKRIRDIDDINAIQKTLNQSLPPGSAASIVNFQLLNG